MPTFPSREWMAEFCEHLRADPRAGDVARALDGVYRFVVEPSGPVPHHHTYDVEIRPADGRPQVAVLDRDAAQPRLALAARYDRWRQLISGELDLAVAVMLRRLRISGDLAGIRGELASAGPLLDALRAVNTRWADDG